MTTDDLHVYDLYYHPRWGMQAVRRGFSWSAFLVPSVWAVRRGLGFTTLVLVALTSLAFDLASAVGTHATNPVSQIAILLALMALVGLRPGFFGHRWHASALEADQFERIGCIRARNARQALRVARDVVHGNFFVQTQAATG